MAKENSSLVKRFSEMLRQLREMPDPTRRAMLHGAMDRPVDERRREDLRRHTAERNRSG